MAPKYQNVTASTHTNNLIQVACSCIKAHSKQVLNKVGKKCNQQTRSWGAFSASRPWRSFRPQRCLSGTSTSRTINTTHLKKRPWQVGKKWCQNKQIRCHVASHTTMSRTSPSRTTWDGCKCVRFSSGSSSKGMFHTTLAVAIVSRRDFTVRIPRRVKRPSEICSRGNGRPRCSIG